MCKQYVNCSTSAVGFELKVPYYADLHTAEASFLFNDLLNFAHACGYRLVWRPRDAFGKDMNNHTAKEQVPVLLVAAFGPNNEEQQYFDKPSEGQPVVLLHHSDEMLQNTDPSIYGHRVLQVFRHYYHEGMGDKSVEYLSKGYTEPLPRIAWMPLGVAHLKKLPPAFQMDFMERPNLWGWAGSTGGKAERTEMLNAIERDGSSKEVMNLGWVQTFSGFAGMPGGAAGSFNVWQYSMKMQQTKFAPIPAGVSPEQYRLWEAFEAGAAFKTARAIEG